jgi:hypothetical protein
MDKINIELLDNEKQQKIKQLLLAGDFASAERLLSESIQTTGATLLQQLMDEATASPEGLAIITALKAKHRYRQMKKCRVQIIVAGEQKITVQSYYALAPIKKRGRPKKGRNGTGTHVLLSYWGFHHKRSPGSLNEIVRAGGASASYELASQQLKSQGVAISDMGVKRLVQKVGTSASAHRTTDHYALKENESLAGKRVSISLDGGRIRSRRNKNGRPKKDQKAVCYETDWKEPKLLVIAEIDEFGMKKKNTDPIYEATMQGKEAFTTLLISLCKQLHLSEATEIVCLGDGAPVLWDIFATLQGALRIKGKTTEVVDFFHACEHITELTQAHSKKTEKQQKQWYKELKSLLRSGKFKAFKNSIEKEATTHTIPELTKQLSYFIRHKKRMRYAQYEKAKLPIGSGIVESAVRRVINGRLKAPGSFWKLENAETMLTIRCALLSGRWDVFMGNFVRAVSLR